MRQCGKLRDVFRATRFLKITSASVHYQRYLGEENELQGRLLVPRRILHTARDHEPLLEGALQYCRTLGYMMPRPTCRKARSLASPSIINNVSRRRCIPPPTELAERQSGVTDRPQFSKRRKSHISFPFIPSIILPLFIPVQKSRYLYSTVHGSRHTPFLYFEC